MSSSSFNSNDTSLPKDSLEHQSSSHLHSERDIRSQRDPSPKKSSLDLKNQSASRYALRSAKTTYTSSKSIETAISEIHEKMTIQGSQQVSNAQHLQSVSEFKHEDRTCHIDLDPPSIGFNGGKQCSLFAPASTQIDISKEPIRNQNI